MRLRKLSLDRIWIFYLTLLFVFGLMIAVFALTNPRFLALKNFLNVLRQAAPTLISAVGMTIVYDVQFTIQPCFGGHSNDCIGIRNRHC